MQPAILALLVSYNSAQVLPACLKSLAAQTGVSVRIVVVDNGSSDGSAILLQQAPERPIVVAAGENLGFAKGCNRGMLAGLQDGYAPQFVLYINPDVRLESPTVLVELAARLVARPAAAIATPRLLRENGALDYACRRQFPGLWNGLCRTTGLAWLPGLRWLFGGYNLLARDPAADYPVPCVTGAFMLCDAAFVRAQNGFDERYFMYIEDVDLCWQAGLQGREVWYVGSLSARHVKGHASRRDSDAMLAALFHSTRLWFAKNRFPQMWFFQRWATRAGLWLWEKMARLKNRLRGRKSAQP